MKETQQQLQQHWDNHFQAKGDVEYKFDYRLLGPRDRRVVEALESFGVNGKAALDVGFGTGRWLQWMKQSGASYLGGLDISREAVERASDLCDRVAIADLEGDPFPFENDFFDVVVSFEVLEHLRDPSLYLTEISRVLKKDGISLVSFPNLTSFGSRIRMMLGRKPVSFCDKTHLRHYVHQEVQALLESHGFSVEFLPTGFTLNPFDLKSRFRFPAHECVRSLEDGIVLVMRHRSADRLEGRGGSQ